MRQMTSPAILSSPPLTSSHRLLLRRPFSPCSCSFHTSTTKLTTRRLLSLQSIKSASDSTAIVDDTLATTTTTTTTSSISASLFSEPDGDESAAAKVGSRVRVKVPLKVYHIPKVPELDLKGFEGVLKQYVPVWKGKHISANLPYKIEFLEKIEGRDAPVKFFAHLKDDEFDYID